MMEDSDYVPTQTENEKESENENDSLSDLELFESDLEIIKPQLHNIRPMITFQIDTDTESASNTDYHSENESNSFFDNLSEEEIADITTEIYELIEQYYETNILNMSSPKFYFEMNEYISTILFEEWSEYDLYNQDDKDEISTFVEDIIETHSTFSSVPKRQIPFYFQHDCHTNNNFDSSSQYKSKLREHIEYLKQIPQPIQRTKEWYDFRNGLISASNLWKVFSTEGQVNSLIYEKCNSFYNTIDYSSSYVNTESSLHWGVKYEPVSVMVFEKMNHVEIGEFGCIQHPEYPFIGASPDGIIINDTSPLFGSMLEIKNIVNREINGIPKMEYWIQTQIQMETCSLDTCHFFETRFLEYSDESEFYNDIEHEYKCVILNFVKNNNKQFFGESNGTNIQQQPLYKYMPLEIMDTKDNIKDNILKWIEETRLEMREQGYVLFSTIYWYLQEYSCVVIPRNQKWFDAALPKIKNVWETILIERQSGYEHRATKKRMDIMTKKITVSNDLSNSYVVRNMPISNSICLVKLDH
jgi:putative phage-type endonuclease